MKNLLFLFSLIFLFSACGEERQGEWFHLQKMKSGDNLAWANPDFDDSAWDEYAEVSKDSVYWIRIAAEFGKENDTKRGTGIMVGGTGSYELWLDGVYLGKNGELATNDKPEISGKYNSFFVLPDSLSNSGEHLFAFRQTQQADHIGQHLYIVLGDYFTMVRAPLQLSKFMFMFIGAFLLTAIYFLFEFISRPKEISSLVFSLICLLFCGLLAMEYLKLFYLYEYPFQRTRLIIIGWLHISLAVVVPLFFMLQFNFPYKKILLSILVCVITFFSIKYYQEFDFLAFTYNQFMWLFSFFIIGFAVWQKKKGAKFVFVGVIIGMFFVHILPFLYQDASLIVADFDVSQFVAFVLVVLVMLYILTLNRREERLAYEASLVHSERLKNELLKKNIKPHFIMNTLTSLIDWVEESPKEGVKFITALAGEFETLNEIADYKLVPVEQEIRLCKNHLKVMSYRKEIKYEWEDKGIDFNEIIPPAIIHTAVENGVTHSLPNADGVITFRLIFEKGENSKIYILQTIAKNRKEVPRENEVKRVGTGLKYIRARLQESYPDKWKMTSYEIAEGWETVFEMYP